MIFQKIKFIIIMVMGITLFLPLCSYASEKFYTVQIGSFIDHENVQKQIEALRQKLDKDKLESLRIEKYKRYYRIRIGKFKDILAAKNFFQTISSSFPDAIILKDSIINEDIIKYYQKGLSSSGYIKTVEESAGPIIIEADVSKGQSDNRIREKSTQNEKTEEVKPEKVNISSPELRTKDIRIHIKALLMEGRYEEVIKAYREAIDESNDIKEKALLHKELGDLFISKDDLKNAAEEFVQALSLYRLGFSEKERLQMAVYITWADRLDEAISETRLILLENPQNIEARVHLARLLSWKNELNKAIIEADRVLRDSPDNRDALLVKANALNWKGDANSAIPLYRNLLEKEEDFDARLGLTYAFLSIGDKKSAEESKKLLRPKFPYQERELKKLTENMDKATKPNVEIRYSYYKDSEDNRLKRYSLSLSFWAGNWRSVLNYRYTDAKSNILNNNAQDLFLKTYSKLSELFGIEAGAGITRLNDDKTSNIFTGLIKADINIPNGVAGVSISREAFTDTPQLIENKIRFTNAGIYLSQSLTERLSVFTQYNYKDYSDSNKSHDVQFVIKYALSLKNPRYILGYRLRYLDFERQSGSGYFDPDDFISNQIFASFYFERERFYISIEPFGGHQSFKRYGEKSDKLIGGAYGAIGFKPARNISLEMDAEGGNYALGTAAGFKYYMTLFRILLLL